MNQSNHGLLKKILIVVAFGIAFGYIESAVVVYLRAIFYPVGFSFPLAVFDITAQERSLLYTEIGREAATIVLIFTASWLLGSNFRQQFSYFLIIFAVWDIFYYIWLKVLLDWPASMMDWDILFFIPVTWASPVLYPILISLFMFILGVIILYYESQRLTLRITTIHWTGLALSAVIVTCCFCTAGLHIDKPDYASFFWWPLFWFGFILAMAVIVHSIKTSKLHKI